MQQLYLSPPSLRIRNIGFVSANLEVKQLHGLMQIHCHHQTHHQSTSHFVIFCVSHTLTAHRQQMSRPHWTLRPGTMWRRRLWERCLCGVLLLMPGLTLVIQAHELYLYTSHSVLCQRWYTCGIKSVQDYVVTSHADDAMASVPHWRKLVNSCFKYWFRNISVHISLQRRFCYV